jgi:hypothetical protein
VIGITPEIIIVMEEGTATPITTELIRFGLVVSFVGDYSAERNGVGNSFEICGV